MESGKKPSKYTQQKRKHTQGYMLVYKPDLMHNKNYLLEHRVVMEEYLGRHLEKGEIVHHLNGDKADNRIENLVFFKNMGQHRKFHQNLCKYVFDFINIYLPDCKKEYFKFMQNKGAIIKLKNT